MRNASRWAPTKFVRRDGRWTATRDGAHLSASSRVMAELTARSYAGAVSRHARGRLLDLGCGHAPLYGVYGPLVTGVTCVDWPSSLHESLYVDVFADLDRGLPLAAGSFDTVLATDVLEHLPHPDRVWPEISRVLRPSGVVILGVPFLYWIHEAPHDYHRYTSHRLRLFCEEHGFEVSELTAYGGVSAVCADTLLKILGRNGPGTLLDVSSRVLARLARPARSPGTSLPLGYTLVARKFVTDG